MKVIESQFFQFASAGIPEISPHEARERKLFGPVYHGTTADAREKINQEGFRVFVGPERNGQISNGYENNKYYNDIPAPVHHLGYGVYFTTSKTNATMYAHGVSRGMPTLYLNIPRLATINFAVPKTQMKWWIDNGYDPALAKLDRVMATVRMTEQLKSKYDAVWFKGKGLRRLLDGDQVCVYEPQGKVFMLNMKLAKPGEIGSKVRRKADGMIGVLQQTRPILEQQRQYHPPEATKYLVVKWQKGGTDYNVYDHEVDPV